MAGYIKGKYGTIMEIQAFSDASGIRVTRKFISSIIRGFAEWNTNYFEKYKYLPIMFRERQIRGGIYKGILDSGACALPEPSIKRKRWGKRETPGWADFIANLRNIVWFLEIKYTYFKLNRKKTSELKWFTDEWHDAIDKIKSIKQTAISDWMSKHDVGFGIVLHGLLIYQRHINKDEVKFVDEQNITNHIQSFIKSMNPKPDSIWIWYLRQNLQKAQIIDERWENYPAICFFIHFHRIPSLKS